MTINIAFFLTIILLIFKFDKKFKIFIVLSISFLYSALRFNIGYDYPSYLELIKNRGPYYLVSNETNIEWLNKFFYYLAHYSHPQIFFIIHAGLQSFFLYGISKNLKLSYISLISYFFLPFGFLDAQSLVRQYTSTLFLLYLVSFNNFKVPKFLFLMPPTFHASSLIYVPLMFFRDKLSSIKLSFKLFIVLFFCFAFLFPTILHYLVKTFGFYQSYLKENVTTFGQKKFILYFILLLLFFYKKDKLKPLYFNLYAFGILLAGGTFTFGIHSMRVAIFPFLTLPILFDDLLRGTKRIYKVIYLLFLLGLVGIFYYQAPKAPMGDFYTNYDFFFNHLEYFKKAVIP